MTATSLRFTVAAIFESDFFSTTSTFEEPEGGGEEIVVVVGLVVDIVVVGEEEEEGVAVLVEAAGEGEGRVERWILEVVVSVSKLGGLTGKGGKRVIM